MSTIIKYFKVNPGGNITAIVECSQGFPPIGTISIAHAIQKNDCSIEQVGFWHPARDSSSLGRLEMAGEEFCGNGLRSLAYLVSEKFLGIDLFSLESSGIDIPICMRVKQKQVSLQLPLQSFSLEENTCILPGIRHILLPEDIDFEEAKNILKKKNFLSFDAIGIISYTKNSDSFSIKPYVWVNKGKTLYFESACGSGSMALAFYMYKKFSCRVISILQPSGAMYRIDIQKKNLVLEGPIFSSTLETIVLP